MATIQIRDVPEDAYETLRRRARAEGKSIQAYMRGQVIELAGRRAAAEAFAEIEAGLARDEGAGVTVEQILDDLDELRR
jgi:plasmid stability protein